MPCGLPLHKKYAAAGNRLFRFPYIASVDWTNLYYDWKPRYFAEPTLFVTVPGKKIKDSSYEIEDVFNVVGGNNPKNVYFCRASSPVRDIDYRGLLEAIVELSYNTEFEEVDKQMEQAQQTGEYRNPFSLTVLESKNLIFRGAPGTGKSYLAKKIAADIISNGKVDKYEELTDEQKKQVEFVQFHPSYDYSDFVEGLRPKLNNDGTMGFELRDGIFKEFVARARKNYEDSQKPQEKVEKEASAQESLTNFFSSIEFGSTPFKTTNGNEFTITDVDDKHIYISIPGNAAANKITLDMGEITKMLESGQEFERVKDITQFFGKKYNTQGYSYDFALYKVIKDSETSTENTETKTERTELKKYVFIIDEINRGEISKIFGELFFALDPGYRGESGSISTQYSNLHSDTDEKFYIPENVYIIGTMNDIDRSVDSFDFAMRRRFRFVEIKANDQIEMLNSLGNKATEAKARMTALNNAIAATEDLNENYQIGPAYFLKLEKVGFNKLWTDYLQPLLQDYVQGMYDEDGLMQKFEDAYRNVKSAVASDKEASQETTQESDEESDQNPNQEPNQESTQGEMNGIAQN